MNFFYTFVTQQRFIAFTSDHYVVSLKITLIMDNSFTDSELRLCQDFILNLAVNAGTMIHKGFYTEQKNIAEKASSHDLVTETDSAVERFLISEISDRFPTHRFIGEEATAEASKNDLFSHKLTDEPTWMIDPIDGTMNFVHTNPNVCISIGLIASKIVRNQNEC